LFATLEELAEHPLSQRHSKKAVRVFIEKGFAPSTYIGKDGTYLESIVVGDGRLDRCY
jgi:hypothetical protein